MYSRGKRKKFTPSRLREQGSFDQMDLCKSSILQERDTDDLVVKDIDEEIGKGVFATKKFYHGDFLLEYHGEIITEETACKREADYEEKLGSYMYFFKHKGKRLCIDATYSTRKGRFINDGVGSSKNAVVKVVEISNRPHLAVFAAQNIHQDEEIRFDYGVPNLPWRKTTDSRESERKKRTPFADKMKEGKTRQYKNKECHGLKKCVVKLPRLLTKDMLAISTERPLKIYQLSTPDSIPSKEGARREASFAHAKTVDSQVCQPSSATIATTQCGNDTNHHTKAGTTEIQKLFAQSNTLAEKIRKYHTQEEIIKQQERSSATNATTQCGNNTNHHTKAGTTEIQKSFAQLNTLAEKIQEYHTQEEIIKQQEEELQEAEMWLAVPYKASVCLTNEAASSKFPKQVVADRNSQRNPIGKLHCVTSETKSNAYSTLRKPLKQNVKDSSCQGKDDSPDGQMDRDSPDGQAHQHIKGLLSSSVVKDGPSALSQEQEQACVDTARGQTTPTLPASSDDKHVTGCSTNNDEETSLDDTEESPTVGTKCSTDKPNIKPHRPCPFCQKFMSKLSKHIEKKHKDEEEVKKALSKPRHERIKAFDAFRKKGILKFNLKTMNDKNHSKADIIPERKGKAGSNLSYCSNCFAFISTKLFHRHRRLCYMSGSSTTAVPEPIKPTICIEEISEFDTDIMSSFFTDETGELCRHDPLIKRYGKHHYKKVTRDSDKKDEKRKSLMSEMRRLGRLYLSFKSNCNKAGVKCTSAIDMFERSNFAILEKSICDMTENEDGTYKDGMKVGMGYLLKKTGSFILGDYYASKEDAKAKEIKKFQSLLNYHWIRLFAESEYSVKKICQSSSRKPQNLPLADDVERLRDFTVKSIKDISRDTYKFIGKNDFVLLRDLLVCRLTLFNARRGGEPSRLKLTEWHEADRNMWHDQNTIETIEDPLDKMLFGRYKLAYQPGKTGKLVPLLIIDDCWKGIQILADPEVRDRVGICRDNVYVFPNTELSKKHVVGWDAVNKCCKLANCSKTVTATNRRHQVATFYASHEVPSSERTGFLMHMDHAENINLNVYQCPPSRLEVTKVGKFLLELDQKGGCQRPYSSPSTEQSPTQVKETSEDEATPSNTGGSQTPLSSPIKEQSTSQEKEISSGGHQRQVSSPSPEPGTSQEKELSFGEVTPSTTGNRNPKRKIAWTPIHGHTQPKQPHMDNGTVDNHDYINLDSTPLKKEGATTTLKKRPYTKWSQDETKLVVDYFKDFIFSLDNLDSNKGRLPGKSEITHFLQKYPQVLNQENFKDRIKRVKLKIFNERKTTRKNLKT